MSNEPLRQEAARIGPQTSTLSTDAAFEVLADGYRRAVLSYLAAHESKVELGELADHVRSVDSLDANGNTATTLHHLHLPKLDEVGVVEYDIDQHTVTPTEKIAALEPYIELTRNVQSSGDRLV